MFKGINFKRLILWGIGFVVLFVVNLLVESIILPVMGLDDTPKNDLYFKLWWVAVGIWLLFGWLILKYFENRKSKRK